MNATSIKLADGYRADWEDNGNRLAVYAPTDAAGYRLLAVWCELVNYVPAWGTSRDAVTEWRAYRLNSYGRRIDADARPRSVDSFDSPDAIAAWLESLYA